MDSKTKDYALRKTEKMLIQIGFGTLPIITRAEEVERYYSTYNIDKEETYFDNRLRIRQVLSLGF